MKRTTLLSIPTSQVRQAFRSLGRSPAFTAVAVFTLALGIAAVTSIFAVLERVVLHPLPYPDAERLVAIRSVVPAQDPDEMWGLSEAGYFHFRNESRTLEAIGASDDVFVDVFLTLGGNQAAVRVRGDSITASMLAVLGASAERGRLFDENDDRRGAPLVVVLSHEVWQAHYGGDPGIVGRSIPVNGTPREVIGIMRAGFDLPGHDGGAFVPLRLDPSRRPVNDHTYGAFARLREGVTLADARSELEAMTARFPDLFPDAYSAAFMEQWGFNTRIEPLRDHVIGNVSRVLWTLLVGVGLVFLIALANVTNLFILRVENRRGEFAIRSAHGASRWRLAGEGLSEGLAVGGLATVAGIVMASFALDFLRFAAPAAIPRLDEIRLDWGAIALTVGLGAAAAFVLGALPRFWSRIDLAMLREGGRGQTVSPGRQGIRRTLVAGQVALALMLLAATGLMLRSLDRLLSQDAGLDARNVLTFQVTLPAVRYAEPVSSARFYRELIERIEALPGVVRAGGATHVPFIRRDGCWLTFSDDRMPAPGEAGPCVQVMAATPGFMSTLAIPVRGDAPDWAEVESGTAGVIVTSSLAERFWPGEDPLGKRIRGYDWGDAPRYTVAGVTDDFLATGLDRAPEQTIYLPAIPLAGTPLHWGPFWGGERELHMVVRTGGDSPESLASTIREILSAMDPDVAPSAFRTLGDLMARTESLARTSLLMLLLGTAAAIALFLSAVGLYGVVSYFVRQRTHEIGLRMALGADIAAVTGGVLRQSIGLALAGVAVGLAGTLIGTRLLRSMLFEIHPNDPYALAAAASVLVLATGLAAWLPARRAARIDPLIALKTD